MFHQISDILIDTVKVSLFSPYINLGLYIKLRKRKPLKLSEVLLYLQKDILYRNQFYHAYVL